jgi:cytochrome c-type biogenesis protein CcmH/NrfG
MAIWHLQDHRYRQERIFVSLSIFGLIAGAALMGWLFWPQRPMVSSSPSPSVQENMSQPAEVAQRPAVSPAELLDLHRQLDVAGLAGNVDETENLAKKLHALVPDDAHGWNWLGWVYRERGDREAAIAAFDRAASRPSSRQAFFFYQKACVMRSAGDLAGAVAVMKEATRLHPGSVETSNLSMVFQIQAGQVDEVRTALNGYATLDLESQRVMWLLAGAALAMKDGETARARSLLSDLRQRIPPESFRDLVNDSFFEPYRSSPEYLTCFLTSEEFQSANHWNP